MNRIERRGVATGFAACLALAWGCAPNDAPERAAAPVDSAPAFDAGIGNTPDFQHYMLGNLPSPASNVRDPFGIERSPVRDTARTTPVAQPSPSPAPTLRGIVHSGGRLVALFDRGTAGAGESISGWRIVEIDARAVVLERGRRRVRRSL